MGLILKKHVNEDCFLGLWDITEDYNTLLSFVNLNEAEISTLTNFKNPNRKLEFLSVRALLSNLLSNEVKIVYDKNGKPYEKDHLYKISISHSNTLTAVLLSKNRKVGIDLEFMNDRIYKIAHKFINKKEQITKTKSQKKIHLYIHWCAKEAIFKLFNRKNLSFKKEILIKPFVLKSKGKIEGIIETGKIIEELVLNYFIYNNYVIVWCYK
jgi:4'-phosphopantetheinyl transferase